MDCPYCGETHGGWRSLHEHLTAVHAEAVVRSTRDDGSPSYGLQCPACGWRFDRSLPAARRDAAYLEEHARDAVLVAFDQLMMHWVEEHLVLPEPANAGGSGGDSERL